MFNIERWQEIFEAISKNRLRTFLTGVSVASGIFILVILLGAGQGLQNGIQKQFEQDAVGIIIVWSGTTTKAYKGLNPGRQVQFRDGDYKESVQKFEDKLDLRAASYNFWGGAFSYGKESGSYQFKGVDPDFAGVENITIVQGRFVNSSDIANNEKVAAIGMKVKTDLFKDADPLGKEILINNVNFKVVGVFTDPGGEREEARAYLPKTTVQRAFGVGDKISNLFFTLKKTENYDEALARSQKFTQDLKDLLKSRNTVAPTDDSGVGVYNSVEEGKKFYDLNLYIRLFFWWVGICTIIAGVVGVSNIMLIIVKERTKEIGIRKALGASPISIISMILHESIFITTIAGFVGLLASLLLLEFVGPMIQSEYFRNPSVDFGVALTTLALLVFAGALAGFFPAYRAAKIKPIVALRDE
ncbi:ABC transporter permease [Flavobacterium aquidurense]|jgi:putative ABC transport system permease protein|uniref:ABC transporter permease n=1 Tax=Flavobacterium aquidurense TaxID=362413 RepID=UPI00091D1A7C|nr:ABC transporter permease [Flavobacterium aquidurense]OXA67425.1 ABC transporter ATP-binding protein [Flavobacterium aquidurense]SHH04110.1 putative ABC transport system permease protein [Flavobacterium frigidimaris]